MGHRVTVPYPMQCPPPLRLCLILSLLRLCVLTAHLLVHTWDGLNACMAWQHLHTSSCSFKMLSSADPSFSCSVAPGSPAATSAREPAIAPCACTVTCITHVSDTKLQDVLGMVPDFSLDSTSRENTRVVGSNVALWPHQPELTRGSCGQAARHFSAPEQSRVQPFDALYQSKHDDIQHIQMEDNRRQIHTESTAPLTPLLPGPAAGRANTSMTFAFTSPSTFPTNCVNA